MKKLINPRGRIVEVQDGEVVDLLKQGFLHVPPDQEEQNYSQVYDKGPDYETPHVKPANETKRVFPPKGDTLNVEIL